MFCHVPSGEERRVCWIRGLLSPLTDSRTMKTLETLEIGRANRRENLAASNRVDSSVARNGTKEAFLSELIDWYWLHGARRKGRHAIPRDRWLMPLVSCRDRLKAIDEALSQQRLAAGAWGPSQTGKSLLARGIDENARLADPADNVSGLHFPGCEPCFFMLPEMAAPMPDWAKALNPYNQKLDASACISRFVGRRSAAFAGERYRFELRLVSRGDVMLFLAHGYESECLGNLPGGRRKVWTLDLLDEAIRKAKEVRPDIVQEQASKEAIAWLHSLVESLESMIDAGLPRYVQLSEGTGPTWKQRLMALAEDLEFSRDAALAQQLAADLFWDHAPAVDRAFEKLLSVHAKFTDSWGDRVIRCDFDTARLILDMDAVKVAYDGPPPGSKETARKSQIFDELGRIRCRVTEDAVHLGLGDDLPDLCNFSQFEFGALQAFVWELVIPVNLDNLPAGPFKEFLAKADLLDFPGVRNRQANRETRFNPGFDQQPGDDSEDDDELELTEDKVYTHAIKTGKTATIVSRYGDRLQLDALTLLIAIDRYKPARPDELNNGVKSIWRRIAPDYEAEGCQGKSPFPINVALSWWAEKINESNSSSSAYMDSIQECYNCLGKIGTAEVSHFFALNARDVQRGEIDDEAKTALDAPFFKDIREEAAFKAVFPPDQRFGGLESFQAMLTDKRTGGTWLLFEHLRRQLEEFQPRKQTLLNDLSQRTSAAVANLLSLKNLFPEPKKVNVRRESILRFVERIRMIADQANEEEMLALNYLLRSLLDVRHSELRPIPEWEGEITFDFIREQYHKVWVNAQVERYTANEGPQWDLLFNSKEELRDLLHWLGISVEGEFPVLVKQFRELAAFHLQLEDEKHDLRPALARELGKLLRSSCVGFQTHTASGQLFRFASIEESIRGDQCFYFENGVGDMLEQLVRLANTEISAEPTRPEDIPGDQELLELCRRHADLDFIRDNPDLTNAINANS